MYSIPVYVRIMYLHIHIYIVFFILYTVYTYMYRIECYNGERPQLHRPSGPSGPSAETVPGEPEASSTRTKETGLAKAWPLLFLFQKEGELRSFFFFFFFQKARWKE